MKSTTKSSTENRMKGTVQHGKNTVRNVTVDPSGKAKLKANGIGEKIVAEIRKKFDKVANVFGK
jgi:hypothetical protein